MRDTTDDDQAGESPADAGPRASAMLARRGLLRAAAAGAAALAGWSALEWSRAVRLSRGSGRVPFNTGWRFGPAAPGRTAPGWDDSRLASVTLPHTVTPLSWRDWHPGRWERAWVYRKRFTLPAEARGKRVFLDTGAALTAMTPVLNGRTLPRRTGGYLPSRVELTDYLAPGGNVLALTVDSRSGFDVPPGRPLPYDSRSIDFWQPGGVYRDVSLRIVPQVFLADVFARPVRVLDAAARRLEVTCTVDAAGASAGQAPVSVEVSLLDGERVVSAAEVPVPVRQSGQVTVTVTLPGLEHIELWDVENPKLYTVRATLRAGGKPLHGYRRRTGFRSAAFTAGGFFLNGRRLKLTGLNRHQFYPFAGGAMPARVQRRDAEILRRELNCNVVRCAHYPQSEAFLDACDELGLLVWEEIPGWGYLGDAGWRQAAARDLRDMIVRDRNHPSVVVWGAMPNEGGSHPAVYARFRELARSLDDSRPTGGDGARDDPRFAFDVLGFHDYNSATGPDGLRYPAPAPPEDAARRPFLVCEAVGTLAGPALTYRRTSPQRLQQGQAEAHGKVLGAAFADDRHCGVIAWSGFDYPSGASGNCVGGVKYTGVVDQFRVLKPGAAIYQSQADPRVRPVIAPAFYWDLGSAYPVTSLATAMICANLDRLEVYVGGAHYASVTPARDGFGRLPYPPSFVDFSRVPGAALPELRIDGYLGDARVASRVFSADTSLDRLEVTADDTCLVADGSDATRVMFRAVDTHGNPRPYAGGSVTLALAGPGVLVGDSPFAFGDAGGAGAVWIRTVPGAAGPVRVTASHPLLGSGTVTIAVVPPAAAVPAVQAAPSGPPPSGVLTASLSREVVTPGERVTLAASFTNNGAPGLTSVVLEPELPGGWTAADPGPAAPGPGPGPGLAVRLGGVGTGQTIRASWEVTVADGAAPRDVALTVLARYSAGARSGAASAAATARVPHRSLSAAFRNRAIASGGGPDGGLDGAGGGYSPEALAAAGLRPGATVRTPDGLEYTWPDGQPDSALGTGQTVLLPGKPGATTLGMLCAATGGGCFGTLVVHYADGPPDVRAGYLADFGHGPAASGPEQRFATVAAMPYHDTPGGRGDPAYVYAVTVPVDPGRPVTAVTLPNRSGRVSQATNAVHVFALTTGTPAVYPSLAAAFNSTGPSGHPDNVLALGQTIRVSGTGSRLGFLGVSRPLPATGTGTVHYADGTASDFTLTLDGTQDPPGGGNITAVSVPLIPGKPVAAVTLPQNGVRPLAGPAWGMHIFALAVR